MLNENVHLPCESIRKKNKKKKCRKHLNGANKVEKFEKCKKFLISFFSCEGRKYSLENFLTWKKNPWVFVIGEISRILYSMRFFFFVETLIDSGKSLVTMRENVILICAC